MFLASFSSLLCTRPLNRESVLTHERWIGHHFEVKHFSKLVFIGEKNLHLLLQIIGQAAVSFPLKPTDTITPMLSLY